MIQVIVGLMLMSAVSVASSGEVTRLFAMKMPKNAVTVEAVNLQPHYRGIFQTEFLRIFKKEWRWRRSCWHWRKIDYLSPFECADLAAREVNCGSKRSNAEMERCYGDSEYASIVEDCSRCFGPDTPFVVQIRTTGYFFNEYTRDSGDRVEVLGVDFEQQELSEKERERARIFGPFYIARRSTEEELRVLAQRAARSTVQRMKCRLYIRMELCK